MQSQYRGCWLDKTAGTAPGAVRGQGRAWAWGAMVCLAWSLAGCGPGSQPAAGPGAPAPADVAAGASAPALDGLDAQDLRSRAAQALREQRIHTPAGDSAVEYYLALRERAPAEAGVKAALAELQPYVVIAAEQALGDGQAAESQRLLDLLARMDPQAPALPRLREGLRTAAAEREQRERTEAERIEAERLAAERLAAERAAAARVLAAQAARPGAGSEAPRPAPAEAGGTQARSAPASASAPSAGQAVSPEAPSRPAASPATSPAATVAAPSVAAPPSPAPAAGPARSIAPAAAPARSPARVAAPRLVADATPRYPRTALSRRIEGRVEIAFSVLPDGSTGAAQVVSSEPAGVFDEAALAAVGRLRFEASGQAHSMRRTLNFKLPSAR